MPWRSGRARPLAELAGGGFLMLAMVDGRLERASELTRRRARRGEIFSGVGDPSQPLRIDPFPADELPWLFRLRP
jgi:hypothetical protein